MGMKQIPDTVVMPLLDLLASKPENYATLGELVLAGNSAMDALNRSSFVGQSFEEYLQAAKDQINSLRRAIISREGEKNATVDAI